MHKPLFLGSENQDFCKHHEQKMHMIISIHVSAFDILDPEGVWDWL